MTDLTAPRMWQILRADQLNEGDVVINMGVIKSVTAHEDRYAIGVTTPSIALTWLDPDSEFEVFGPAR